MKQPRQIVPLAIAFEAALGLAGWWLAEWAGVPIRQRVILSWGEVGRGVVALLPMVVFLAAAIHLPWRPLTELKQKVTKVAREMFAGATLFDLALVSFAAGLGEEILFRGAIQPLLIIWTNVAVGVIAASILFGALHAASVTYFIVALLMGGYLGWLTEAYDDLVAPVLVHAAYDFIALAVICQSSGAEPAER